MTPAGANHPLAVLNSTLGEGVCISDRDKRAFVQNKPLYAILVAHVDLIACQHLQGSTGMPFAVSCDERRRHACMDPMCASWFQPQVPPPSHSTGWPGFQHALDTTTCWRCAHAASQISGAILRFVILHSPSKLLGLILQSVYFAAMSITVLQCIPRGTSTTYWRS